MANFPVEVTNLNQLDYFNLAVQEGVELEGIRWKYPGPFVFGTNTIDANGGSPGSEAASVGVGGYGVPLSKSWYINNINMYVSHDVYMQILVGYLNVGARSVVAKGSYNHAIKRVSFSTDGLSVSLQGAVDPTVTRVVTTGQVDGWAFSSDTNYNAKLKALFIGDSNTEGGSVQNATSKNDLYSQKFINWLNDEGVSIRRVDKSIGGKSSIDYNDFLRDGKLDVDNPSLIIYNLGTNDFNGAATDVQKRDGYLANLANIIQWKKRFYPNTILVVCAPFVASSGSTREVWLNTFLRPAIQSAITTENNPNILFCNFANVLNAPYNFVNNTDTFFSTNDSSSSGQRLHHNAAGHELDYQVLRDFAIENNLVNKLKAFI